jgi:hypothetical protein
MSKRTKKETKKKIETKEQKSKNVEESSNQGIKALF